MSIFLPALSDAYGISWVVRLLLGLFHTWDKGFPLVGQEFPTCGTNSEASLVFHFRSGASAQKKAEKPHLFHIF